MSTEFTLLLKAADKNDPASANIDIYLLEKDSKFSLNFWKTHPTIMEASEEECLVKDLTTEQIEHLAVRLLCIASKQVDSADDLMARYNLCSPHQYNNPLNL